MAYRQVALEERAVHSVGRGIVVVLLGLPLVVAFAARAGFDILPDRLLDWGSDLVWSGRQGHELARLVAEAAVVPVGLAALVTGAGAYVLWWFAQRTDVFVDEPGQALVARVTRWPLRTRIVRIALSEVEGVSLRRSFILHRWVARVGSGEVTLCLRVGGRRRVRALDAYVQGWRGHPSPPTKAATFGDLRGILRG